MQQGGTFEERNVTAWAKEQLEALLVGLEHSTPAARVSVSSLTSATGEAHVWIMRHKKR
jgi:activator of HSP90 ATPase